MKGMSWKATAVEILNMYQNAQQILDGEISRPEHMSVVQFNSAKVKAVSDPTGSKVVQLERLRAFIRRVDEVMKDWDEEEREIIRRKYLAGHERSDKEVLQSLKLDGYRIPLDQYHNAKNGALANLVGMLKGVA